MDGHRFALDHPLLSVEWLKRSDTLLTYLNECVAEVAPKPYLFIYKETIVEKLVLDLNILAWPITDRVWDQGVPAVKDCKLSGHPIWLVPRRVPHPLAWIDTEIYAGNVLDVLFDYNLQR